MLKLILTFGLKGDYNVIRRYALKYKIFIPLYKLYTTFHCAAIPLHCKIMGDLILPHSIYGCFFSTKCEIGNNCTVMQHVTIGSNFVNINRRGRYGAPRIGNNVFIGAGAKIIGPVTIGDNVNIGAGCIVVTDIPANTTVVMNKPRILYHAVSLD